MLHHLNIKQQILDAMVDHARAMAPVEACGILSGEGPYVTDIHIMTNGDNSPDHFSLLPEEQFAVAKAIRAKAEKMLAVYHSHPATPARPSEEDRRLAFAPGVIHVIVSLMDPREPDVKGFLLDDDDVASVPILVPKAARNRQSQMVKA